MRKMILMGVAALAVTAVALMARPGVSRDAVPPASGPAMPSSMELTLAAKDLPTQAMPDAI